MTPIMSPKHERNDFVRIRSKNIYQILFSLIQLGEKSDKNSNNSERNLKLFRKVSTKLCMNMKICEQIRENYGLQINMEKKNLRHHRVWIT